MPATADVTEADVRAARAAVGTVARHTPILSTRTFSERAGGTVVLKAENLQRTGSFKVRGVAAKLEALGEAGCAHGVVAASALGMDLPATGLVVGPRTVLVGLMAGVVVTMVSAISPARRASRIPPVAAIQDVAAEPRRPLARRTARGAVFTRVGLMCLAPACSPTGEPGPAGRRRSGGDIHRRRRPRAVFRAPGQPTARRAARGSGTTGKLGQQNAMRNPSRTAATAAR